MQKVSKQIDLADLFQPKGKQNERFTTRAAINIHEFYLNGEVESSDEYIEWFDIIRNCSQTDVVKIYINSHGGDLFTAIQLMNVLRETQATVVVAVEGACMSAATMIFLTADQFIIADHTMFMFHNYSGMAGGKGGEIFEQIKHERAWSEKLLTDVYEDFLTTDEIQSMLNNRDIWMDGDEVAKRLEAKKAKMDAAEAEPELELKVVTKRSAKPKE